MEHQANYFSLYNFVPVGICVIDSNYEVIFWNTQLEIWTNIKQKDILNNSILEYNPRISEFKYKSRIDEIFQGGPPTVFSSQIHGSLFPSFKKGAKRQIHQTTVSALPAQKAGQYFAIFSIEDVSELSNRIREHRMAKELALEEVELRKKAEMTLRESETKLKELNATKDKFFSIIAHDLKNPLSVLLTVTDFLKSIWDDLSQEEIKEFVFDLNKSAKQLYNLLENLLTWARSQRGNIPFQPDLMDLSTVGQTTIDLLKMNAEDKNINLFSSIPANTFVYADNNMITTVVRNLTSNAVKFTPRGGRIEIKAVSGDDFIEIGIRDSGVGLSPEDIAKLFRLDVSHTTIGTGEEKGTGLGLIMCKDFIDKHQGKIWAESTLGEGSEFIFRLPKNLVKVT